MKNQIKELDITAFSKSGNGLSGKVEVPFAIPGDKVLAKIIRKSKGIHKSLLEQVVAPSADRITPRCIHFGVCGGCRWQQMHYSKQLDYKSKFLTELFQTTNIRPIIPCDPPWHHRNKMEFSFSQSSQGDRYLGLIMNDGKGKAINLSECHLVDSWFIQALHAVKGWWDHSGLAAYHMYRDTGSLRTLTVREGQRTGDRMLILTVSGNPDFALNRHQVDSFKSALIDTCTPKEGNLSLFLRIQQVIKGTPTNFYEIKLHGSDYVREVLHIADQPNAPARSLTFNISPQAFFQPNTRQAEQLYSAALQLAEINESSVVYDLYCGTGTLGICAAKRAAKVIGIELSKEAVLDAIENLKVNDVSNMEVVCGDVGKVLAEIKKSSQFPQPDIILLDPPRAGLGPVAVQQVLDFNAKTVVYVSCNPVTQAVDIKSFIEVGYVVTAMQPVDQFPHTPHLENIIVLTRD